MTKKKNYTKFQDYESAKDNNGYEVGYIRMTDLQLICMNELSANSFRLYIMMKNYAKGKADFTFPHRIYKNFISNQTFIVSRQELIDKGYIEPFISNANLRIENKYKFSSKWKEHNKENISNIINAGKDKLPNKKQ
jgi:hypothetical protein